MQNVFKGLVRVRCGAKKSCVIASVSNHNRVNNVLNSRATVANYSQQRYAVMQTLLDEIL